MDLKSWTKVLLRVMVESLWTCRVVSKQKMFLRFETKRRAVNVINALGVGKALIMVVDIGLFEVSVGIIDG